MYYLEARTRKGVVRWPVRRDRVVIGRGEGCDIVVPDPSISRRHLEVRITGDDRVIIRDLGSTNGTWLEEQRIDEAETPLERWFAAGSVLLSVRKGVSLSSLDPSLRHPEEEGSRPLPAESPHTAIPGTRDTDPGAEPAVGRVAELLEELSRAGGHDESLRHRLLAHVLERLKARTVLVLQQAGNGWAIAAAAGEPLDAEVEAALELGDLPEATGKKDLPGGPLFWKPLEGPAGTRGAFLVQPFRSPVDELPDDVRVVAAVAASWLVPHEPAGEPGARKAAQKLPREEFIAVSGCSRQVLEELDRLAPTGLPLLLQGESGTGKELLARRIHACSDRAGGPFVAINCAALPRDLLEAELFGIEKAVATGVAPRPGKFALASGGTLFLDEIGDLPSHLQPKLLRALENGHIHPLGAPAPIPVDVRVVSASHQDLRALVEKGRFREDLLYRLAGAVIHIPPLRERPEDIFPLVRFFAAEAAREQGKRFLGLDRECARVLLGYSWPGNVRELRHVVSRAVALADGEILHAGLLPREITGRSDTERGEALLHLSGTWREAKEHFERAYFHALLQRSGGNLSKAARSAGLSRSFLYRKLEELGLR